MKTGAIVGAISGGATLPGRVRDGRGPTIFASTSDWLPDTNSAVANTVTKLGFVALWLAAGGSVLLAQSFPEPYTKQGEVILAHLNSAPFPHPSRAEGHIYKEEMFSAKEHYSDNTVAIFIPKTFRETGVIDFVVHFHGWRNNVAGVFQQYQLVEQLLASDRNAVLVVPQGPKDAPDSAGGKLEDPGGFKRFMADVQDALLDKSALKRKDFRLGRIILSGHSGGYRVISSILDRGGLTDQIREVWLFDALYAENDKFLTWQEKTSGRLINLYTQDGGTKAQTEEMMKTLKQRGDNFLAAQEAETTAAQLQSNRLIFLYTSLPHNDVLDKHQSFQDFLKTSCLESTARGAQ